MDEQGERLNKGRREGDEDRDRERYEKVERRAIWIG